MKGVTRKERIINAMLEGDASACCGVSREERNLAMVAKAACDGQLGGGGGGGELILELSEDGKTVLTPKAEYCEAYRAGKTVKLDCVNSSWGEFYNLVMSGYTGNPGYENKAYFTKVFCSANVVNVDSATVTCSTGTIETARKTLTPSN